MRFKLFLEGAFNVFDDEPQLDVDKFKKDCEYYLSLGLGKRKMFRGVDKPLDVNQIYEFKPRTKPLHASKMLHDSMNEFFEEKFGHPFRNGLFVTGDEDQADAYGYPYIVVPVGKFEWLSSPKIRDAYVDSPEDDEELIERIRTVPWLHNEDLTRCIRRGHEIMLWCPNGYYLLDDRDYPPVVDGK